MLITTPKTLAITLKDYRKRKKLTQNDIATQVGLRQATISDFEKSPDKVTIETLFKIVTALDLEMHLLPQPQDDTEADAW